MEDQDIVGDQTGPLPAVAVARNGMDAREGHDDGDGDDDRLRYTARNDTVTFAMPAVLRSETATDQNPGELETETAPVPEAAAFLDVPEARVSAAAAPVPVPPGRGLEEEEVASLLGSDMSDGFDDLLEAAAVLEVPEAAAAAPIPVPPGRGLDEEDEVASLLGSDMSDGFDDFDDEEELLPDHLDAWGVPRDANIPPRLILRQQQERRLPQRQQQLLLHHVQARPLNLNGFRAAERALRNERQRRQRPVDAMRNALNFRGIRRRLVQLRHENDAAIPIPVANLNNPPLAQPDPLAAVQGMANAQPQHQAAPVALPMPMDVDNGNDDVDLGIDIEEEAPDDDISSYLFDLIRENRPCSEAQSGWSDGCCNGVVQRCREHPTEARYSSPHGRSPLHEACLRKACSHVVRALLNAHPMAASSKDLGGNTPLHLLFVDFSFNHFDQQEIENVVTDLLAIHPEAETNDDLNTPLHIACMSSENAIRPGIISRLVAASPSCASSTNMNNQTPLRLHCERQDASVAIAKILVEAYPGALDVRDGNGRAPIHYAAANSNVSLLQYFVTTFPESSRIQTSNQETAFHVLCRLHPKLSQLASQEANAGRLDDIAAAAKILLNANADANMVKTSVGSHTPLHLLCKGGDSPSCLKLLQLLLDSAPFAARLPDSENYLPLHYACETGCDAQIIEILLRSNPEAARALTRKRDTALSLSCMCNKSVDSVNLLIEANPDALTLKNDYGFAPIHCVCRAHLPRMGIVEALLKACPSSVLLKTNSGETPVHLFSSNRGASASVLHLLTRVQNEASRKIGTTTNREAVEKETDMDVVAGNSNHASATNKIGNTPLHDACFRGSRFENIETLLLANPEWVSARNKAGFTALQILCKNGNIDEQLISLFLRIGGAQVFSVIDDSHSSPLHSAIREDMRVDTLKCLIRANPQSLRSKTLYGHTPLHLACFRRVGPEVVRELVMATSCGDASLLLERNVGGQTPIGIAVEEFRNACRGFSQCCVTSPFGSTQRRAFDVLSVLVKILYYGPVKFRLSHDGDGLSLLHASLALHRQGVRLDPIFIRRVIHLYPGNAFLVDELGNHACHIEASIPVEKMTILDGKVKCCEKHCTKNCHERAGILSLLLDVNPGATKQRNRQGQFPLGLMINSGRKWGQTSALPTALRAYPAALHWHSGLHDQVLPFIFERIDKDCGSDTLYSLLRSRPGLFEKNSK